MGRLARFPQAHVGAASRFPTPTKNGQSTPPFGSTPNCGSSGRKDNAEKLATEFVLKTLKKRLFSCPAAFLTTLEQHEKSLRHGQARQGRPKPSISILKQELDRMDEEYADDTEYDEATADAVDAASLLFTEPTASELALLKQMKEWAEKASWPTRLEGQVTDRLAQHAHLDPARNGSNERVIIFTEYRATQNWLKEVLAQQGFTDGDRLLTMYGGMDLEEREEVKAAFQTAPEHQPGPHPARHRRRLRRLEPPEPLLPAHPLRNPVEPEPDGAAQRAYRPPRPEGLLAPTASDKSSSTTSSARATRSVSNRRSPVGRRTWKPTWSS